MRAYNLMLRPFYLVEHYKMAALFFVLFGGALNGCPFHCFIWWSIKWLPFSLNEINELRLKLHRAYYFEHAV
jgi:hypothetical protein